MSKLAKPLDKLRLSEGNLELSVGKLRPSIGESFEAFGCQVNSQLDRVVLNVRASTKFAHSDELQTAPSRVRVRHLEYSVVEFVDLIVRSCAGIQKANFERRRDAPAAFLSWIAVVQVDTEVVHSVQR